MAFVQFSDAKQTAVCAVFACPQDPEIYPNQMEIDDSDPRYKAFISPAHDRNSAIKAELADLDGKSIRTLHEAILALASSGAALPADIIKRLQDVEKQKQKLRDQLVD